jgi:2-polyprenyl-3-methyl-5-hydroxy-6-metoxy-1,4-benzoquinol methylase
VEQMKKYSNYYCTAKDRLVTGELFSVYFDSERIVAKTKINDDEDMYRFYKSSEYHSHQLKPRSSIEYIYFLSRKIMMFFKHRIIYSKSRKINLLDYGCGNGDFIEYLSNKSFKVTGIEKSLSSQKICRSKGLNVFSSVKLLGEAKFDVIMLWHVLEHVINPPKCIRTLSNFLTNDGSLIVAAPNIQSVDSQVFKEEWAGLDVPRHLWHFTPKGLIGLLIKENFVLYKKYPLLLDAYYVSLLSAKRKKMPLPWIVSIFIGTASNLIAFFTGNFSSSVYVFKKAH